LQPTPFQARRIRFSTDVDNSAIFGGKIGYWFDFFPLVGAELDIYAFRPDISSPPQTSGTIRLTTSMNFDLSVTAVSLDLMGRYPLLKSPDFPRGRIQPYIGIGPGLFITSIEDLEPDPNYKFSHFTADLSGAAAHFSLGATQNIAASHFYGGVAYHFY
jgi:hypothetical protein